ncbi:DUF4232 domain-containing protein [Streptacidiphilus rugosus]|uniref:DUF4232 domain-containing protein n=1 Tax=Streptacidiphilus rugosus TaxID=405783 RepID=UPI00056A8B36|nr:DUF4232 domain-containing protein [Streptacidiphilus rugosus]
MQRTDLVRGAVAMMVAGTVVGLSAACDPAATAGASQPTSSAVAVNSQTSPSPQASSTPTSTSGTGTTTTTTTTTTSDTMPHCAITDVSVGSAKLATVRPNGTGTGAVVVAVTNTSSHTCSLRGFPTVAAAGEGAPDHNKPLTVRHKGSAVTVPLSPGGRAWVKLTFVQVQGEADGYCVSGATPATNPTIVLGLPGAGGHQIGMDDGSIFATCDNVVTVTALSMSKPA